MKARRYICFLLAAALSLSLCACGSSKPKPELTVESYTELQTIQKLPPVYVPGGNWTEADIPGALWVGAGRFSFPATFTTLGSKFSIDPSAETNTITEDGEITAILLYDGCACGEITLTDCTALENYSVGKIRQIIFRESNIKERPSPALFPVCFNGITIGSTAEQVKDNLGIELGNSGAEIQTAHHTIRFTGSPAEGVTKIILISGA